MADLYQRPGRYRWTIELPFRGMHYRAARHVCKHAPRHGAILDVGTGPGTVALKVASARRDVTVHGVDVSEPMVDYAARLARRRRLARFPVFALGDVRALPYQDDSMDVITSVMSVHHWTPPRRAARELTRVLRRGGRIFLYEGSRGPLDEFADVVRGLPGGWTVRVGVVWNRWHPSPFFRYVELS